MPVLTLKKDGVGNAVENFASPWFSVLSALDVNVHRRCGLHPPGHSHRTTRPVSCNDHVSSPATTRKPSSLLVRIVTFQTGQTTADAGRNNRPRTNSEPLVSESTSDHASQLNATSRCRFKSCFRTLIHPVDPHQQSNPVVDRREATTTITVKNNQTIVISGIRKEEETDVERKVPLLGDIPILGNIFKSTNKTKGVTELLIFITPVVVDNPDENDDELQCHRKRTPRGFEQAA